MYDWNDSRFLMITIGTDLLEVAGAQLVELWRRRSGDKRLARTLQEMKRQGLIDVSGTGSVDARVIRLTTSGRSMVLGPVNPEALWSRVWDGRWRLVLFDVAQAQSVLRDRLRRRLREARCGWLQNSVWLTPDPLDVITRELHKDKATVESLVFLEARPVGGESDAELVAGAWDWDRIGEAHASYLRMTNTRPGRERRGHAPAWEAWARAEQAEWREVVRIDPFLPESLWPAGYAGRAVWKARLEALRSASDALVRIAMGGS
jgi:phenylacetic acid degradation operon negative regulatory protein